MTGERDDDALDESTVRVPRDGTPPEDPSVRVSRAEPDLAERSLRDEDHDHAPADNDGPDESTVLSEGRTLGDTQLSTDRARRSSAAPGPRRNAAAADGDEPEDGSTVVARRESRRRAARDEPPASPGVAPAPPTEVGADDAPAPIGRTAQTTEESNPGYGPRAAEPFIAVRSTPPPRLPQKPVDVRGATLSGRRRAARLALVAVVAASFVITVLVAALVTFTTSLGW